MSPHVRLTARALRALALSLALNVAVAWAGLQPTAAFGQSISGRTGLLFIPTAHTQPDGTFTAGAGFVHRSTTSYLDGEHHFLPIYASLVFLPGLELTLRFSRALSDTPEALGDRMVMVKWQLWGEGALRPAIAIGADDFLRSTGGETNNFHAAYVVTTKTLRAAALSGLALHAGYGFRVVDSKGRSLPGFFAGASYPVTSFADAMAEYDGERANLGVRLKPSPFATIVIGLRHYDTVAGGGYSSIAF